jgi:hypothetical protein
VCIVSVGGITGVEGVANVGFENSHDGADHLDDQQFFKEQRWGRVADGCGESEEQLELPKWAQLGQRLFPQRLFQARDGPRREPEEPHVGQVFQITDALGAGDRPRGQHEELEVVQEPEEFPEPAGVANGLFSDVESRRGLASDQ